jgi:hypothetical protein
MRNIKTGCYRNRFDDDKYNNERSNKNTQKMKVTNSPGNRINGNDSTKGILHAL